MEDWGDWENTSGTPINEDYNVYVKQHNQANRILKLMKAKRDEGYKNRTWKEDEEREYRASWCAPCIKEMPVIAGVQEKYKDRSLAVIGVSSDTNELAWKSAIERYKMKWLQLISVNGKDEIGKLYNVKSIPFTLIIDSNGTIVSRRLRGEELVQKIDVINLLQLSMVSRFGGNN